MTSLYPHKTTHNTARARWTQHITCDIVGSWWLKRFSIRRTMATVRCFSFLTFFDQLQAKDLQVTNARIALAHALTKEAQIPQADLKRALERKSLFEEDPKKHTYP